MNKNLLLHLTFILSLSTLLPTYAGQWKLNNVPFNPATPLQNCSRCQCCSTCYDGANQYILFGSIPTSQIFYYDFGVLTEIPFDPQTPILVLNASLCNLYCDNTVKLALLMTYGGGEGQVQVFRYNGLNFTQLYYDEFGNISYYASSFGRCNNDILLALALDSPILAEVFRYDPTTLTLVPISFFSAITLDRAYACDWSCDGTNALLALVGDPAASSTDTLQVFKYEHDGLIEVPVHSAITVDIQASRCTWCKTGTDALLAIAGAGTTRAQVFKYDGMQMVEVPFDITVNWTVYSCAWCCQDSTTYLAMVSPTTGRKVRIYRYDGSQLTNVTFTISLPTNVQLFNCAWCCTNEGNFLVISGTNLSTPFARVYKFDGSSLSLLSFSSPFTFFSRTNCSCWECDGKQKLLALGGYGSSTGGSGPTAQVFDLDFDPCPSFLPLVTAGPTQCNGQQQVTLSATGGTGSYSYSLTGSGGPFLPLNPNPLTLTLDAGIYSIIMQDNSEPTPCQKEFDLKVNDIFQASATPGAIDCYDGSQDITLTATGGTPIFGSVQAYYYSLDGQTAEFISPVTITVTTGTHTISIFDDTQAPNGPCTHEFTINVSAELTCSATATAVSCYEGNDGTITVNATGGTPPYQYSLDGGMNWQDSNLFENLIAGIYSTLVRDYNDCECSTSATVTQPTELTANVVSEFFQCSGLYVKLVASGGIAPYFYSLNNGAFTEFISGQQLLLINPPTINIITIQDSTTEPYGPCQYGKIFEVATPKPFSAFIKIVQ